MGKKSKYDGQSITIANRVNPERFHFCPTCPPDENGRYEPMKATQIMPKKRMVYNCKNGHTAPTGGTLLR
jgi:hypothetical protein